MGRFARKFKKSLGNESVNDILNTGTSIKAAKEYVLRDRKIASKQKFVNNNLDKLPNYYSDELLNIANATKNTVNNINIKNDIDINNNENIETIDI